MSENPYAAPQADLAPPSAVGVRSGSRADVRRVAFYQKGILVCILGYFAILVLSFVLPPELAVLSLSALVLLILTGTVFVFLLAIKVYNVAIGIVLGIGAFLPLIGLIVLLIVNGKATRIMQENGIRVGLLGADLSKI